MKKGTILIVDDNPLEQKLLMTFLKSLDHDILVASSGEEALDVVRLNSVDLILLDVMMPGIGGFEVAKELKQKEKYRGIPIVMVTALNKVEHRVMAMDAGADDFLSKPVDKVELKARVQSLLKVKAYNDHIKNYQQQLEIEVGKRTEQLKLALDNAMYLTQKAEAANIAKSEFMRNMSHELRTPLNAIINLTDLVIMGVAKDPSKSLELVKFSANSLLRMINEVLDFSAIEMGKFQLEPTEFVINDILSDNLDVILKEANKKGLMFMWNIAQNIPKLKGDSKRLAQVIFILLDNAVKFTEIGEIKLDISLESEQDDVVSLMISVKDTGIGISQDKQDVIFQPFNQADNSMTRKYGGVGLGLSLANQLVQLMGGNIQLLSELGQGSLFYFSVHFIKLEN